MCSLNLSDMSKMWFCSLHYFLLVRSKVGDLQFFHYKAATCILFNIHSWKNKMLVLLYYQWYFPWAGLFYFGLLPTVLCFLLGFMESFFHSSLLGLAVSCNFLCLRQTWVFNEHNNKISKWLINATGQWYLEHSFMTDCLVPSISLNWEYKSRFSLTDLHSQECQSLNKILKKILKKCACIKFSSKAFT